ncbi:MAG: hypothetical protein PWP04_318 [Candidatus Atribacteria bacterium]|nr:hypothetical protein [Candidatus Atribacteria bacterium]
MVKKGQSGWQVLLVRKKGADFWTLPKGHVERNETLEQAGLREIEEETGLSVELGERIGKITYVYVRNGQEFQETVHFFLACQKEGEKRQKEADPREIAQVGWFSPGEALRILGFANEKEILRKAQLHLK